jgi:uncharacterized protein (DUF305 family)
VHEKALIPFLSLILPVLCFAQVPIVQPGAPGEDVRILQPEQAIKIAKTAYSPDDVRFMQDMIPHHHQATQMAALVTGRTNQPGIIEAAGRIDASQADEIAFMQQWLADRGETVPEPTSHDAMHTTHAMAGMASPEQMAELAAAEGRDFDRMFLQLMIRHHDGAVRMVEDLLEQPGSAYDPVLFEFTSDITNDQTAEIERMNQLLITLSDDPRANLAAGFDDAGQAIWNLELVATLPKPPGFADPDNPVEAPARPVADEEEGEEEEDKPLSLEEAGRKPMLGFTNTDMAFRDDILFVGSYHGFNIYRLRDNAVPELLASVVCPGGQGDVSVVGDLLFMSAQETRGRLDCGLGGVSEDVSAERFRGLRIFDISDLTRPVQVGAVQTCRGSHTHSVVSGPDEDGNIIVYNSGTSSIREEEELPGCFDELPGDDRTALFRIDVIQVPVDNPGAARIIDSPAVFADPETGALAGLWRGGDHGDLTQETRETNQCHDITVFPEGNIAAGACSGNGIIFDISDPKDPQRIDVVTDSGFYYWHSATFNNDGTKVLFTDEWGGGNFARCRAWDPRDWGANAIYDIVERKLEYRSHFKIPAPQGETENCVAHNGSIVPVPGRDIFAQAWYQGGVSLIDFTDSANPVEIAYFDRGPLSDETLIFGGYWSVYWYGGALYGTETMRGLDIFKLLPSEFLTENEIAAATLSDQGRLFNPQQQFKVSWPAEPVVARTYMDQLARENVLDDQLAAELDTALNLAAELLVQDKGNRRVARTLENLASTLGIMERHGKSGRRLADLAQTLVDIAERL